MRAINQSKKAGGCPRAGGRTKSTAEHDRSYIRETRSVCERKRERTTVQSRRVGHCTTVCARNEYRDVECVAVLEDAESKTVHVREKGHVVIKIVTRDRVRGTETVDSYIRREGDQEHIGILMLVLVVCKYAHSAVSGDSIGGNSSLPSQNFKSCPSLFSKPRQFPHSGNTGSPALKVASYEMTPESCLLGLRRVRAAVAEVGREGDGKWARMR